MKLFFDDARILRRLEFFFAFAVTSMTKAISFSAYLFSQFLDQFIEILNDFHQMNVLDYFFYHIVVKKNS
jgi:hypothetical protein